MEFKKIYNKIFLFISLIIILFAVLIVCNKLLKSKEIVANYKINSSTTFLANQKDNNNSSNQKLFVSNMVDSILVNFNYNYSINKKQNLEYRYDIIASVISDLDDSNEKITEVYKNDKKIVSTNYKKLYSDKLNIIDSVSLNYDYYNLIASKYNNSVNIPIKSKLLLKFNLYISVDGLKENKYTSYLSFPLEKSTFSITTSDIEKKGYIEGNNNNIKKIFLNVIIISTIIVLIILIVIEVFRIIKYKNEHVLEFKYRKIMQDYNNIVVPITGFPNDKNIINIRVLFFKSMIDIQKELHVPILCYKAEKFIVYIIISNKIAYMYFLNNKKEKI